MAGTPPRQSGGGLPGSLPRVCSRSGSAFRCQKPLCAEAAPVPRSDMNQSPRHHARSCLSPAAQPPAEGCPFTAWQCVHTLRGGPCFTSCNLGAANDYNKLGFTRAHGKTNSEHRRGSGENTRLSPPQPRIPAFPSVKVSTVSGFQSVSPPCFLRAVCLCACPYADHPFTCAVAWRACLPAVSLF